MMKTTKLMIASAALSFVLTGAAYADSGSHTPAQIFSNQAERVQTAQASQAEMPAPRPGWNKGSQYGVEWLTRKTDDRSEVSATGQRPTSTERAADKTCARPGFSQHNNLEHVELSC